MLANVQQSQEVMDTKIKEYDAVTRRIAALEQAKEPGMTEQQAQDIAMGVVHSALAMGDLVTSPEDRGSVQMAPEQPAQPPEQPQGGMGQ